MQVQKEFKFEASHILKRHPGKCSRLHGHSWRVIVTVEGPVDSKSGFVADFADLKKLVQPLIDRWDHRHLNCFVRYPTSENIATHVAWYVRNIMPMLNAHHTARLLVEVSETQSTWARWDSNDPYDYHRLDLPYEEAEWYTPDVTDSSNVPQDIATLQSKTHDIYARFEQALIDLEQYQLYVDSMKPLSEDERKLFEAAKNAAINPK